MPSAQVAETSESFRYKVVSIQVDSIEIEVDLIQVESRFDSTQPLCSQLFSGPIGAKIAIPVSQ